MAQWFDRSNVRLLEYERASEVRLHLTKFLLSPFQREVFPFLSHPWFDWRWILCWKLNRNSNRNGDAALLSPAAESPDHAELSSVWHCSCSAHRENYTHEKTLTLTQCVCVCVPVCVCVRETKREVCNIWHNMVEFSIIVIPVICQWSLFEFEFEREQRWGESLFAFAWEREREREREREGEGERERMESTLTWTCYTQIFADEWEVKLLVCAGIHLSWPHPSLIPQAATPH